MDDVAADAGLEIPGKVFKRIRASDAVSGMWPGLVFLYFHAQGVAGTFEHHRLRKAVAR